MKLKACEGKQDRQKKEKKVREGNLEGRHLKIKGKREKEKSEEKEKCERKRKNKWKN